MSLADLNVRIGAKISGLQRGLSKAQKSMRRFSRDTGRLGDAINQNITRAFAAVSAVGTKLFLDLSSNFSKIENLVGVTGATLDNFKDGVKRLSVEVGKSQVELSKALFVVTSAGLRGAEAMEVLSAAGKASVVGLGDTTEIARVTTAVIQAYGKENINAAQAANVLFNTIKEGNLDAAELAPKLGNVIGVASKMGVTFAEVGANIATFTRLGVGADTAVTSLTAILSNFLAPGKATVDALEDIGLSAQDVRDSIANNGLAQTLVSLVKQFEGNDDALGALIPNIRALKGVLGVTGNQTEDYIKIVKSLTDDTDGLAKAFDNVSDKPATKLKRSLVQLQNAAIDIGAIVVPVVVKIAEKVSVLVKRFSELDAGTKRSIVKWTALVSAFGVGLKIVSSTVKMVSVLTATVTALTKSSLIAAGAAKVMAAAQWLLNKAMLANPVGLVIAGVAALVAGFATAYKKSESFRASIDGLANMAKVTFDIIKEAVSGFVEGWQQLKDGNFEDALKSFGKGIVKSNPLVIAYTQGGRLANAYSDGYAESMAKSAAANVSAVDMPVKVSPVPTFVPPTVVDVPDFEALFGGGSVSTPKMEVAIDDTIIDAVEFDGDLISKFDKLALSMDGVTTSSGRIKDAMTGAFDKLQSTEQVIAKSKLAWIDLSESINAGMADMAASFGEALGSFAAGAGSLGDIGLAMLKPLIGVMDQLANIAISTGIAIKGIKAALKSLNPIAAIGAGIALKVLSGVMKSKLSALSAPRLARGGMVTSETMAIIGDNPSGKEAVIPFERMGEFLNMAGAGAGDVRVHGNFQFAKGALTAAIEQDNYYKSRIR